MLWKPRSINHWIKAVHLVSEFNQNVIYPMPHMSIFIAARCGEEVLFRKNSQAAIIAQEPLLMISVAPATLNLEKPYDFPTIENVKMNLEDLKERMKAPVYVPTGGELKSLPDAIGKINKDYRKVTSALRRSSEAARALVSKWCEEAFKDQWRQREVEHKMDVRKDMRQRDGTDFEEIPTESVDEDDPHPNCLIYLDPLVHPDELAKVFFTAGKTLHGSDESISMEEPWSKIEKRIQAVVKAQEWLKTYQAKNIHERKVNVEVSEWGSHLFRSYSHLGAARDAHQPSSIYVQAVRLRCGHATFGREWIIYFQIISGEMIKNETEWAGGNMTCPYCRGDLRPTALVRRIALVAETKQLIQACRALKEQNLEVAQIAAPPGKHLTIERMKLLDEIHLEVERISQWLLRHEEI
jgi:hypothetical protein